MVFVVVDIVVVMVVLPILNSLWRKKKKRKKVDRHSLRSVTPPPSPHSYSMFDTNLPTAAGKKRGAR